MIYYSPEFFLMKMEDASNGRVSLHNPIYVLRYCFFCSNVLPSSSLPELLPVVGFCVVNNQNTATDNKGGKARWSSLKI